MNLKKTYMINNNTPTEIDTINKSLKSSLLSLFFIQSPSYVAVLPRFFSFQVNLSFSLYIQDHVDFLIYMLLH